jgi:hypothetical protein
MSADFYSLEICGHPNKSAVWVNNWHTQKVPVIKEVTKIAHADIFLCL